MSEDAKRRRAQAVALYDEAVKNLGLEPTPSERRNAILSIMEELQESAKSQDGLSEI